MTGSPVIEILVVGRFPAADEIVAGRYLADQVAALTASGRVRPSVVSFENAALRGSADLRGRQEAAVIGNIEAAIRAQSPFARSGSVGPDGVPVARIASAAGTSPGIGGDHRATHRASALLALVGRPGLPTWRAIHAHVGYPEAAAAARAAARLGIPLIVTEHASSVGAFLAEPVVRSRYLETMRGAARVVAVSRVLANELVGAIPDLDGRVVVIPNAVAVDDFRAAPPAERAQSELLFVGYRKASKGIPLLLEAFSIVLRDRPDAILRLIGRSVTDADEAGWHSLAAELGVAHAVRFEPPADRAGVAAAMSRATLFVHPSGRETFGVVAAEALASGLPVVARDSGGVTEILGDDPDAFGALVHGSDPRALAEAIGRTIDRRMTFDSLQLRAHVAARYGAAAIAGQLERLYEEVREGSAPGSAPADGHPADDGPRARATHEADALGGAIPAAAVRPSRTIIVGFSRTELDRALASFPAWVTGDADLVTTGSRPTGRQGVTVARPGTQERVAVLLGWGAPPARRTWRRGLERLLRPVRARFRRSDDALVRELTSTLDAAVGTSGNGDPPLVVCLSGIDHLAAAPLVASGRVVPAPGGLRWLADERRSAGFGPD